jgi:hypothetical protein
LLDDGDDMILILAKAAGCSWTTVRELLSMFAAKRRLDLDGLTQACDRYKRLSQQTARNIVAVHEQRMKRRAKELAQAERLAARGAAKGVSTGVSSAEGPSAAARLSRVSA